MFICLVPTLRMRQIKIPSRFFLRLQLVAHDNLAAVENGSLFKQGGRSGEVDPESRPALGRRRVAKRGGALEASWHRGLVLLNSFSVKTEKRDKKRDFSTQQLCLAPRAQTSSQILHC